MRALALCRFGVLPLCCLLAASVAAMAQSVVPNPPQAGEQGFTQCVEDWKVGPPAIYGRQDNRLRLELELPDSCREQPVFYEVTGRDKAQKATCDFSVVYGSGGSSERIRVEVLGQDVKGGEIPSYVKEPARRVRVRCFTLDEYKPFDARLCVRCGKDVRKDDAFGQELEKFLKQ